MKRQTVFAGVLVGIVSAGLLGVVIAENVTSGAPQVSVGSAEAMPGEEVKVRFTLTKNEVKVVTIAPLQVTFDGDVLEFEACTSLVAGKNAAPATPSDRLLSVVISGDLQVLPDGEFLECRFSVAADAPPGESLLRVLRAEVADDEFKDSSAYGSSGVIRVLER